MRSIRYIVILASVGAIAVAGTAVSSTAATKAGGGTGTVRAVGLVTSASQNDHSYGQSVYTGLVAAGKKYGVKVTFIGDIEQPQAALNTLTALAHKNQLIIAALPATGSAAVLAAAKQFPKVRFVTMNGVLSGKNISSIYPNWFGPGYLAGVIAATASKTHVVGFLGGRVIPAITSGQAGYIAGAESVDPSIKVVTAIASMTDPLVAKNAAASQIDAGADVIWGEMDSATLGVADAFKASGKPGAIMGAISPKCSLLSGYDIGDVTENDASIVSNIVRDWKRGKLKKTTVYSGQDPTVQGFAFCPGQATPQLTAAINTARADLKSGKAHP